MVFAPVVNPNDTSTETITNIAFYPDITVADFRQARRIQDTVNDGLVVEALRLAMMEVNRQLNDWKGAQVAAGSATINDVQADQYGGVSEVLQNYLNAVYSMAKAKLLMNFRDMDATASGGNRADSFDKNVDEYARESHNAINNILGNIHLTVELI